MPNQREMLFLRPSGVLDNIFELLMIPSSRTFDKDCDGKLKPEELLGILTWDNSKLPEGLQEVIEEFQDSDGLIFYEGTLNNMYVKHTFLIYLKVWLVSWRMVGLQRPKMPECIKRKPTYGYTSMFSLCCVN